MNIERLQALSTMFNVSVVVEEYHFLRIVAKVVGKTESAINFIKDFEEELPAHVTAHCVSSQLNLPAEIKYFRMKLKAGLINEQPMFKYCVIPSKTLKPGVYIKFIS